MLHVRTENVTELAIGAFLLPRSLITVSSAPLCVAPAPKSNRVPHLLSGQTSPAHRVLSFIEVWDNRVKEVIDKAVKGRGVGGEVGRWVPLTFKRAPCTVWFKIMLSPPHLTGGVWNPRKQNYTSLLLQHVICSAHPTKPGRSRASYYLLQNVCLWAR